MPAQDTVYLALWNGRSTSPTADVLKAALWWYDSRHETGQPIDSTTLRYEKNHDGSWTSNVYSYASDDNKQFSFAHGARVSSTLGRLALARVRVTSSDSGCGSNPMKVYSGLSLIPRTEQFASGFPQEAEA